MTEQRDASVDDTSWAPATGGFFADDTPFGSVLGDPLMGSPLFDVSVLDATPGTQPEDDALYQDRSGLSDEERAQVARADSIKAGAARRDAAHRQAQSSTRRQQAPGSGALQYGYVPTAQPGAQPGFPPPTVHQPAVQPAAVGRAAQQAPGGYVQPGQAVPVAAGPAGYGYPQARPASTSPQPVRQHQPGRARPTNPQTKAKTGKTSAIASWFWPIVIAVVVLRACAG